VDISRHTRCLDPSKLRRNWHGSFFKIAKEYQHVGTFEGSFHLPMGSGENPYKALQTMPIIRKSRVSGFAVTTVIGLSVGRLGP